MHRSARRALFALVTLFPAHALGADWTNNGGNAARNGQTSETGPDAAADVLWSMGRSSIIAWQPVTLGTRIFTVRQTGFPPEPSSNESPVVCMDLDTGAELWFVNLPAVATDWTTWIAGVSNDQVYVARSGNGASVSGKIYALDVVDGSQNWQSAATVNAGAYDGVVFAPDGDLIVGDFSKIVRINADDGATVWSTTRLCSVSSSCGVALSGSAVYAAEPVAGGHVIARYDLATGVRQYQSPLMTGFTLQNTPMVGPDGTVYLSRTQNNALTDFFYAFTDSGSALTTKWSLACGWSTFSEFAVGPDGSIYMIGTDYQIKRLDPATGAILNTSSGATGGSYAPRMAVDAAGRVFYANGVFPTSTIYSYNADLSSRWSVTAPSVNIGAPAIGADGTLIVASTSLLTAYRTPRPPCPGDLDDDGDVDLSDLGIILSDYGCAGPSCVADINDDMVVDLSDLGVVLAAFGVPCP